MRAPTRIQNSKSLNKTEGKKEWGQRHLDESRKRHKKKRKKEEFMINIWQNKMTEIRLHLSVIKTNMNELNFTIKSPRLSI